MVMLIRGVGLRVDAPFPGDHQCCTLHRLRQIDRIQHNLNTRFNIRIEEYRRRNAHTARSAAARHLADINFSLLL